MTYNKGGLLKMLWLFILIVGLTCVYLNWHKEQKQKNQLKTNIDYNKNIVDAFENEKEYWFITQKYEIYYYDCYTDTLYLIGKSSPFTHEIDFKRCIN